MDLQWDWYMILMIDDVHYVSLFTYKYYIMYICIILYMHIIT